MKKITLSNGTEVVFNLNFGIIEKIRKEQGIDILDLLNNKETADELSRPYTILTCLFCCQKTYTDIDTFVESITGEDLEQLNIIFMEEIIEFLPKQAKAVAKGILKRIIEKKEIVEDEINQFLEKALDDLFGNVQESQE